MSRRSPLPRGEGRCAPGCCEWCGEPVTEKRRSWHPDCVTAFQLHNWPQTQIKHVRQRDGAKCAICGERPQKWLRGREEYWHDGARCSVERVDWLDLDHRVPLWSVRHLPAAERLTFYGPDNLWLLCGPCHKRKTAREAAERAQIRRAA